MATVVVIDAGASGNKLKAFYEINTLQETGSAMEGRHLPEKTLYSLYDGKGGDPQRTFFGA